MAKLHKIDIDSPISEIIVDFRKKLFFGEITNEPDKQHHHYIKEVRNEIANAHVFDFGSHFDAYNKDFITADKVSELMDIGDDLHKSPFGFFLPHDHSIFVMRHFSVQRDTWEIALLYLCQQADTINAYSFSFALGKGWSWLWYHEIWRRYNLGLPGNNMFKLIVTKNIEDSGERVFVIGLGLASIALFLLKQDVVFAEPVEWWYTDKPAKPKAFQIPNPRVSILKVNTQRIIRPDTGAGPTGATKIPHPVRSHPRQVGNRITIVKSYHTGNKNNRPDPPLRVVKLDKT